MKTHNYVFIQIVWCIFGYDVIQTICFFFLEKSSRLLWAKKQAHVSSAVGAYWNPCVLNRKFKKNGIIIFALLFFFYMVLFGFPTFYNHGSWNFLEFLIFDATGAIKGCFFTTSFLEYFLYTLGFWCFHWRPHLMNMTDLPWLLHLCQLHVLATIQQYLRDHNVLLCEEV